MIGIVDLITQAQTMVNFARFRIPLERRLQTFAVSHFVLCFLTMALWCIVICIFAFFFTSYWWLLCLYFVFYFLDWNTPANGGRTIEWVRSWSTWTHMAGYFPTTLHKTVNLDPSRNYIFGVHPHGVLCIGSFTNFSTNGSGFRKIFPGMDPHLTMLPLWFKVPFYREYLMAGGLVPSSKESIQHIINDPRGGQICAIIPGGAPESLLARPGNVELILKPRMGFIKIALINGVPLVPVFSFGDHALWEQEANPPGSKLRHFQDTSQRLMQFALPLFHARGIFQYNYGLLPYRRSVDTIVGEPIEVKKNPNPTSEELLALQDIYISKLRELFEKHRSKYMPDDWQLVIQ